LWRRISSALRGRPGLGFILARITANWRSGSLKDG
jgi:hypothetical protein